MTQKMAHTNVRHYNQKTSDLGSNFEPTMAKNSHRNRTEDFRMAAQQYQGQLPESTSNEPNYMNGNTLDVRGNLHRINSKPMVNKNQLSSQNVNELIEVS